MSRAHSPIFPSRHLRHNSFSSPSVALPTSQLILQPFRCLTYVTVHSPTLLSLLLRHKGQSAFSNLSVTSPTSQHILQHSVASPSSQLILQLFRCFIYVTVNFATLLSLLLPHKLSCVTMSRAHSPIFPSLHLRHNSFSSTSVALPTSQLILQPFLCFTYITVHSPTLLSLLLRHKLFTWRAAHGSGSRRDTLMRVSSVVMHVHIRFKYLSYKADIYFKFIRNIY